MEGKADPREHLEVSTILPLNMDNTHGCFIYPSCSSFCDTMAPHTPLHGHPGTCQDCSSRPTPMPPVCSSTSYVTLSSIETSGATIYPVSGCPPNLRGSGILSRPGRRV